VVYLLHFERPYKHARHYVGYTDDLDRRLAEHRSGSGARLLAVIAEAGIGWTLARTWPGGRDLERAIKRAGHTPRLCPICNPGGAWSRRAGG
jgi:predicted GIY-YIG superfamily endonuclease